MPAPTSKFASAPTAPLTSEASAYLPVGMVLTESTRGSYFPDTVVAPFAALLATPPVVDAPQAPDMPPVFSYAEARKLIEDALEAFDPALGKQAKAIFNAGYEAAIKKNAIEDTTDLHKDPVKDGVTATSLETSDLRWRLKEVDPGKMRIMRSLPGGSEASEFNPANPNNKSVIQFEFDGSINSLIYLAHEVGHSIADDYIRDKSGAKLGDNPLHLDELQAYFAQNIMYDALKKHPDENVRKAAQKHFTDTMAENMNLFPKGLAALEAEGKGVKDAEKDKSIDSLHSRPMGILTALGLFKIAQGEDAEGRQRIADTLLGREGPKNINEVLVAAGVTNHKEMQDFARMTVKEASSVPDARAIPAAKPSQLALRS